MAEWSKALVLGTSRLPPPHPAEISRQMTSAVILPRNVIRVLLNDVTARGQHVNSLLLSWRVNNTWTTHAHRICVMVREQHMHIGLGSERVIST